MTKIIAITGGICSGKSTISNIFSHFPKISIIDSDQISKKITQLDNICLHTITKYFGPKILLSNGKLNRSKLKNKIFSNPTDKKWLEQLLFPLIQTEIQKKIAKYKNTASYILWVTPLLIENNLQKYVDRVLVIDTSPDTQLIRIINRDKINKHQAKKILLSQASRNDRFRFANEIIKNEKQLNLNNIKNKIHALHKFYLSKN